MLIIPMLVTAYASGSIATTQRQIPKMSPNYKMAPAVSVLGSRNTPSPEDKLEPLEPGVHLHFILPDAFTHAKDETHYPAVPNRYIVTRIWQNPGEETLKTKCAIIESDFISTDKKYKNSVTIPFFSDPDRLRQWRYLGRNYPPGAPPNGGEYLDKLTAVGVGDTLFAAYYPNCRSVFGFHDDCSDLPNAPSIKLTYFVTGYFSNRENDPFNSVKTADELTGILSGMKLSVDGQVPDCNCCVLFGVADAVDWRGFSCTEYCPEIEGRVDVAFGNTSAEALSFAIANTVNNDFSQRMITALQYNLYDETEKVDGNFKIDDEIFYEAFSRSEGAELYNHLSIDKNATPCALGEEYSKLRKLGREVGKLGSMLESLRVKLFCAWEQFVWYHEDSESNSNSSASAPPPRVMLDEINVIIKKVQGAAKSYDDKKAEYDRRLADFQRALPDGVTCPKSGTELFFAPKDPVLLLSGEGIMRSFAFGEDGRFTQDGTLLCQYAPISANVGMESLFSQCFPELSLQNLPDFYGGMLFQATILSKYPLEAVENLMGKIERTGTISEVALNRDPLGRITLFMIWGASYHPTRTNVQKDNTLDGWRLEYGETSLVYRGGFSPSQITPQLLGGKILLTPHAVKSFAAAVARYADIYDENPDIKEMAGKIKSMAVISQNLSGFSDYFSGLSQALQFPIAGFDTQSRAAAPIITALVTRDRMSVLPDAALLPLRGGFVKITDLSLVSTFGQTQKLAEKSYYNNCEIGFAETVDSPHKDFGLLPPAFSSPARLNADFVCADRRGALTSAAPETSPVCGIFIPELLNHRLLAYTANGTYLGMIKIVYRAKNPQVRWLSAPELPSDFEQLQIKNTSLRNFIKTLLTTEKAFYELYGHLDKYLDAKQYFGSLIWGRPLVLADLMISLDLSPAYSKRIEDFGKYDTLGTETVRIPLKLGDINRVADGLLGFFCGEDFSQIYPSFGAINPYDTEGYVKYSQNTDISVADGERHFTVLIEPDAPFTIHTGILPVKTVQLEPEHAKVAHELPLSAELAPVLGCFGQTGIPTLGQEEYSWHVLSGSEYQKSALTPPIVSFDNTVLMDGLIVRE